MQYNFKVENIKCGGCTKADTRHAITKKLTKLGYPEMGTADSDRLMVKAASYVSCALGKVSGKN